MKTFNETQMRDPWAWCMSILVEKHGITSKQLSDAVDAPRSTVRSLYNGSNANPRYGLLMKLIDYCIRIENGDLRPGEPLYNLEPEAPVTIEEFL